MTLDGEGLRRFFDRLPDLGPNCSEDMYGPPVRFLKSYLNGTGAIHAHARVLAGDSDG